MNLKILSQPYPFNNNVKKELFTSFLFGTFVFLFLAVFQPFGLSQYNSSTKIIELLGYGAVTFVTLFGNSVFFSWIAPKWFSEESWTVGKNIIYTIYILFCIGLGNLLYSVLQGFISLKINSLIFYQGITLLVGIFPVTISTLIIHGNRLKKAINEAKKINNTLSSKPNNQLEVIEIPSLNKSESLKINMDDLIAVRAVENYVEVWFERNNSTTKEVLRNTLKNMESFFAKKINVVKCHRSYLVNINNIHKVSGNAQGLKLLCGKDQSAEVAVSRNYVKTIKTKLSRNETIQ